MKLLLTFFIWGVLFLTPAAAQFYPAAASNDTANYPYWYRMMQDPDISFYATQSAFYKYWAGRSNYRHNGWKVFKRWEYLQQNRLGTNGKPLKTQEMLDEYNRYMKSDRPFSPGGNWIELGPKTMPDNLTSQPNGMGRVNAVAFHPVNADIIFAGAASGGLWKSVNNGSTWTLIAGLLPAMGVSSILVHPAIPDTILIGTGDRDGDNSQGVGVYRSVDGGLNWAPSNTGMGKVTVGMMIRHPSDNNVILAATHKGIFKSINGGATWTLKSENTGEYKDIRFKPANPSIVYATENGNFYRSSDTGETWDLITTGIISGSRMVIGVSPNAHGKVYLCQTNGPFAGLLSSSDSGLTFTARSTKPNLMGYACDGSDTTESQANYDLCMAVDPNNAQTIYIGGVNVWKSIDGGVNWKINAHWIGSKYDTSASGGCHVPSIHADIHSLDWSPKNGKLYSGNDGGVYVADNGGLAWTDISSGLAISQIYKIGQSTKNPQLTIQGYQDNGTAITTQNAFATVVGGDGMQCIIDYADTNYRYAEEYDGKIKRSSGSWYYPITDSVNGIQEKGAWVTPFILDKAVPSRMFAGFRGVWRSVNIKTGNPKEIQWTKISSEVDTVCNVLEQSPANVKIIYVSRNYKGYSVVKRTSNADAVDPVWTTIAAPDNTPSSYVTDIKAHPTDSNIVYA
ncbi:MAG: hypothetical protein WCI71_05000, partial [Bacteroidota bacterium]